VLVTTLDEDLSKEDHVDFIKIDTDGSEPLTIQGATRLISRSPHLHILAEYQPGNLKRYVNNPMNFLTIANNQKLKLSAILDSEKGRLSYLDIDSLKNLPDNQNLDLVFSVSN
jgi:hypothetical protein